MDNTSIEDKILMAYLGVDPRFRGSKLQGTYCLSQGTSASLSTDENHNMSGLLHVLHSLSASDICVLCACEKCRYEHWRSGYQLCSKFCALQDVIFEDIGDNILVVVLECVVE